MFVMGTAVETTCSGRDSILFPSSKTFPLFPPSPTEQVVQAVVFCVSNKSGDETDGRGEPEQKEEEEEKSKHFPFFQFSTF
jgi:hypothetical protein